jgi:hypothetical protein
MTHDSIAEDFDARLYPHRSQHAAEMDLPALQCLVMQYTEGISDFSSQASSPRSTTESSISAPTSGSCMSGASSVGGVVRNWPARRVFRTTPHPSPRGRKSSPTQTLEAPDIEICLCPVHDGSQGRAHEQPYCCNDEGGPARRVFRTTPPTLEAPDMQTWVVAEYSEPCNDETERPARRVFRTTPHPSPRGRKSSPTQTLEAPDIEICLRPVHDEGGPARRAFRTTPYPSKEAPR